MKKFLRKTVVVCMTLGALGAMEGCALQWEESESAEASADESIGEVQQAVDGTIHSIITCQSATQFYNYPPSAGTGANNTIRTLTNGRHVGVKPGAGDANWAVVNAYGEPSFVWGFVLRQCINTCSGQGCY